MNGGLLLPGTGAPALELALEPRTREQLLQVLGISPVAAHTPLKRHPTGLTVRAVDEMRRELEADVYVVARAHDDCAATVRVLDIDVPAPAVVVAQKPGGSDFSEWVGYAEPTGFLRVKSDLRAMLEEREVGTQFLEPNDARYFLQHLECSMRDLGAHAPKDAAGVLRLVALDAHGYVAMLGNFYPGDWLGMRNFGLRAFDARLTAYAEGVLRAPVPVGSTAESAPMLEFVRWSEKPAGGVVKVRIEDKVIHYGVVLSEPVGFDRKKTPARVPVAGLPIFGADGQESKPVTWSRA